MFEHVICFAAIDWPKTVIGTLIATAIATLIKWAMSAGDRNEAIRQAERHRARQAEIQQAHRKAFEQALKRVMVKVMVADGRADESEIDAVRQICQQVCGTDLSVAELKDEAARVQQQPPTMAECVRDIAPYLTDDGKSLVIRAAFMVVASDRVLHEREKQLLIELGTALRMPPALSRSLLTLLAETAASLGMAPGHLRQVFEEIGKSYGCPRCGFRFGWDGTSCTHCHYNADE